MKSFKELKKSNQLINTEDLLDVMCGEQEVDCSKLKCVCDGKSNTSIESEDDILF